MNVFFAGLATETNSFSSIPTAEAAFALGQRRGEAVFADRGMYGEMARALRELVEAEGGRVIPGLFAFAQPAAPTVQAVYERLRDALLDDLRAAMPVDMVMLFLHGAMISQDCWDCEGEILAMVRQIVGPATPVGVVLDPHAHLTDTMLDEATVLCFQKEYPHIDGVARLGDAFRICRRVLAGEARAGPRRARLPDDLVLADPERADARLRRPHAGARGAGRHPLDFVRARISLGRHAGDRGEDAGVRRRRRRQGRRARPRRWATRSGTCGTRPRSSSCRSARRWRGWRR